MASSSPLSQTLLASIIGLAAAAVSASDALAAEACVTTMARQTFDYLTPAPKDRDPRGQLPAELTNEQRRSLHPVLWPSSFSARFSVSHWLSTRNFECLEQGFSDLDTTQARFPDGSLKMVSFLGAARDFAEQQGDLTRDEIAELLDEWRKQVPRSLLAELLEPRLLMAAAWVVRGGDYANKVPPDRMREFRQLNAEATQRVHQLRPEAQMHVMGHYIALRALVESGADAQQVTRFALKSLQRYPEETGLALIAGQRMLPKWGGSHAAFERFAASAMEAVGRPLATRLYATLYAEEVGINDLYRHPLARQGIVKAGLMELASTGSFEAIATLQTYACTLRDAQALRYAQDQWVAYARQPQLRAPSRALDAPCRQWEQTLPRLAEPKANAPAVAANRGPALQMVADPAVYRVSDGPWQRSLTPVGETFECTGCEYPVQVLIAVGSTVGAPPQQATHEHFLSTLRSSEERERVARLHIESAAQLNSAGLGYELLIEKTGFSEINGVRAFSYESTLRLRQRVMRETAWELIHKGRLVRISVYRADGPIGPREREAIRDFVAGIKLVGS